MRDMNYGRAKKTFGPMFDAEYAGSMLGAAFWIFGNSDSGSCRPNNSSALLISETDTFLVYFQF